MEVLFTLRNLKDEWTTLRSPENTSVGQVLIDEKNRTALISNRIVTGWYEGKLINDADELSILKCMSNSSSVTSDVRYLSSRIGRMESHKQDNCRS